MTQRPIRPVVRYQSWRFCAVTSNGYIRHSCAHVWASVISKMRAEGCTLSRRVLADSSPEAVLHTPKTHRAAIRAENTRGILQSRRRASTTIRRRSSPSGRQGGQARRAVPRPPWPPATHPGQPARARPRTGAGPYRSQLRIERLDLLPPSPPAASTRRHPRIRVSTFGNPHQLVPHRCRTSDHVPGRRAPASNGSAPRCGPGPAQQAGNARRHQLGGSQQSGNIFGRDDRVAGFLGTGP